MINLEILYTSCCEIEINSCTYSSGNSFAVNEPAGSLTANEFPDEYVQELISISQQEVYRISKLIMTTSHGYEVSDSEMKKTLNSPACLGDLELTCFYNTSRNRQLGLKLTKDCNIKKLFNITVLGQLQS